MTHAAEVADALTEYALALDVHRQDRDRLPALDGDECARRVLFAARPLLRSMAALADVLSDESLNLSEEAR